MPGLAPIEKYPSWSKFCCRMAEAIANGYLKIQLR